MSARPDRDSEQGVAVELTEAAENVEEFVRNVTAWENGDDESDYTEAVKDAETLTAFLHAALSQQHSGDGAGGNLDRNGKEISRGDRVLDVASGYTYTAVAIHDISPLSVGVYGGPLEDWKPTFCTRYVRASDLEIIGSGDDQQETEAEVRAVERIAEELVSREQLFNEEGEMLEHHWPMVEDLAWSLLRAAGNPQQDDQQVGAGAVPSVTLAQISAVWTRAMADPGAFVEREINPDPELEYESGLEPLINWQFRALLAALPLQAPDPVEGREDANLKVCAVNVVQAWDNPSPGPEKWSRLKQKIEYLREAL